MALGAARPSRRILLTLHFRRIGLELSRSSFRRSPCLVPAGLAGFASWALKWDLRAAMSRLMPFIIASRGRRRSRRPALELGKAFVSLHGPCEPKSRLSL